MDSHLKLLNQESIVELLSSIKKHYQLETNLATIKELDEYLKKDYQNVVLMVFDGFGMHNAIKHLPPDSILRKNCVKVIHSVFPPTTTAAINTFKSGKFPVEHGWFGWRVHLDYFNDQINLFNQINEWDKEVRVADDQNLNYKQLIDSIKEVGITSMSISPFDEIKVDSLEHQMETIIKHVKQAGKKYIYTYNPQPDMNMHQYGIDDYRSIREVKMIDEQVNKLASCLNDTLLIITADHALIDCKSVALEDYPDLTQYLKFRPTIEDRCITFHITEGNESIFKDRFMKHFKDKYLLLSKEEAINLQLFGKGQMNPNFEQAIGQWTALAITNESLVINKEHIPFLVAQHAGLTKEEMEIPLIIIEC